MHDALDLSTTVVALAAAADRWERVFEPAVLTGCVQDGLPLRAVRVDPVRTEARLPDDALDAFLFGAAVLADAADLGPRLLRVVAWEARVEPGAVALLWQGSADLTHDLRALPLRAYSVATPADAALARRLAAGLAVLGAHARAVAGRADRRPASVRARLALRRRRERSGVAAALRAATRAVQEGDLARATEALAAARAEEPAAPDLSLRAAVLERGAGQWPRAVEAARAVLARDPGSVPAWRELGLALDGEGAGEAEDALRRAASGGDHEARVSLAGLLGRRGAWPEAVVLLEQALVASPGHPDLVLRVAVLRAAREGRVVLAPGERDAVQAVLAMRAALADDDPPQDAPWSHFDALQACLLLDAPEDAVRLARAAREHVHAPWEAEVAGRALEALEGAGIAVAEVRDALGLAARRRSAGPTAAAAAGRPFEARARALSDLRRDVPCAAACPVGTDAGSYVTLVGQSEDAEAFRVARGPNPFATVCGRVCAAPCEDACRRGKVDEPVAIRALKRWVCERHGPGSADDRLPSVLDGSVAPCMEGEAYVSLLRKDGAAAARPGRVAVVGGGPSGLACAHDLAFLGHKVTVFEASGSLGGMMRLGIPEYRLPRDVLDREIAAVLSLGVEVRTGAGLGAERTVDSLFADGFDAVYLASGAGRGRDLEVEGGDLDGVVRAIDFLINLNAGYRMEIGRRVVVAGGGNVAMDVARTARLGRPPGGPKPSGPARAMHGVRTLRSAVAGGAHEVHVVARQPLGEWPAQRSVHGREEVEEARSEGVVLHPLRGLRRILGENGRVVGVELAEVVTLRDTTGRYAPVYGAHAAETLPCDTVFLAVGQEPDLDYLAGTQGLERTRDGLLRTDPATLATSRPGVFAGGDAAFGPRTLIEAVAEGKRAARSVHARLSAAPATPFRVVFREVHPRGAAPEGFDLLPRADPPRLAVDRRTGVAEVEGGFGEAEARRQARRCLACHVQTVYDGGLCVACGRCTEVCPYRCLSLADASLVGGLGAAAGDGRVAMLKDETSCVRCGLCAERCPTGAMTMERFDWKAGAQAP